MFFPTVIWLGLAPVLFGILQFVIHGIVTNAKLRSLYNPGSAAVVLGHIPIGAYCSDCCARAASGHAIAAPLKPVMNSRRFI